MTRRRLSASLLLTTIALALIPTAASAATATATDGGVAPEPVAVVSAPNALTNVNDFVFESLDVEYELGRDADGRSTLRTVEHFVAVFPEFDQNRGMIRAVPAIYDGHSTELQIVSVTDETGTPRDYELGTDGDFRTITIAVPLGQFVHGEQHYVIEYTQRDVTKHFADTNDDEFYWDVNGTGWAQPFGRVSATVTLEPGLSRSVTEATCYQGWEGSNVACDELVDSGDTVTVAGTDLSAYQNVTVVIAFTAGTFAAAPWNPFALIPTIGIVGVAISLLSLIYAGWVRFAKWRDEPGRGTVIAQYEPPEGVSLFLAAEILGKKNKAMPAEILDLAVRHWVRIRERDASWGRTEFGIEPLEPPSGDALLPDEARILAALSTSRENGVKWLKKNDTALGRKVIREAKSARSLAVKQGLRRKPKRGPVWIIVLAVGGSPSCSAYSPARPARASPQWPSGCSARWRCSGWASSPAVRARQPQPAHEGRLRAEGALGGARRVHPLGRGRPSADAAERHGRRTARPRRSGGWPRRPRPGGPRLRAAPALRGAVRAREAVGLRALQVLRRPVPRLVLQLARRLHRGRVHRGSQLVQLNRVELVLRFGELLVVGRLGRRRVLRRRRRRRGRRGHLAARVRHAGTLPSRV